VAELLDSSVASVNSALQRARATLDALEIDETGAAEVGAEHAQLLADYVDAFERYDIDALVTLLQEDVVFSMPPHPMWLVGPAEVQRFMLGHGIVCQGSRTLPIATNGRPGLAVYHPMPDGSFEPWSVVDIEVQGGRISAIHNYLFPNQFASLGLPPRLPA
jgi:RNA polymerase sigma-70 factor (ECF subfamily)